jgi:type VI secretion system protein ImpM
MMTHSDAAGFFGKIPSHGDFVARRLPAGFTGPWDAWLQAGMADSRARLGDAWLPTYLNSPIWRFALAAGVCGPQAWSGVMMPSVDRVGRYFPFTIAAGMDGRVPSAGWYESLEALALTALGDGFSLPGFDAALLALAFAGDAFLGEVDGTSLIVLPDSLAASLFTEILLN